MFIVVKWKSECVQKDTYGTSLVVQWLRLHASKVGGMGLIPDQGTKIHLLRGMAQKKICMDAE